MSMSDCSHCGYSNSDTVRFCVQCGTNLSHRSSLLQPADRSSDVTDEITKGQEEQNAEQRPSPEPSEPAFSRTWPPTADDGEDAAQDSEEDAPPRAAVTRPEPLLPELQGLLEPTDPLAFVTFGADTSESQREALQPFSTGVNEEDRRQLRELFSGELPLAEGAAPDMLRGANETQPVESGLLRQPRLEWLLLLGLIVALLWGMETPAGGSGPHPLPGLFQAHQQVESLLPNSLVLVNWAYDPATAGEMDLVAQPVIEHLLREQAQLIVVSQLPGGPATARRLIARAEEAVRRPARFQVVAHVVIEAGYLPGGAASLPLLGVAPAQTLPVDPRWVELKDRFTVAAMDSDSPVLNLVLAARVEDVRRWLEQVQPLNDGTVIAVTSAAADPALRPYLHSGQLAGLVSGWDGGRAYQRRSERTENLAEQAQSARRISGQNWGFGILLVTIVLGNLAGLTERRLP